MRARREGMRARLGTRIFGLTMAGGLAAAAAALAATVPIDGTQLRSNHATAFWNPVNDGNDYCLSSVGAYTPVTTATSARPAPR